MKSTRLIDIEGFVDAKEVHHTLFDAPYFAGRDGDVASKKYALLTEALRKSDKVEVAKVVLRDRESMVFLVPHESGILMYKLRYPEEICAIIDVPNVTPDIEVDPDQLKMADVLIDSMSKKFKDMKIEDKYNEALKAMIDAKIEGKEIVMMQEEEYDVVDIMTSLKASIDKAKESKKPMEKASGKKDTKEKKVKKAS